MPNNSNVFFNINFDGNKMKRGLGLNTNAELILKTIILNLTNKRKLSSRIICSDDACTKFNRLIHFGQIY